MKKNLLAIAAFGFFSVNQAGATGFMYSEKCTSVLNPDSDPEIVFATVSHAAPGGPVYSTTTTTIEGIGQYQQNEDGSYDEIDLREEYVKTPSGNFNSALRFISLDTGSEEGPELTESVYLCKAQSHARPFPM